MKNNSLLLGGFFMVGISFLGIGVYFLFFQKDLNKSSETSQTKPPVKQRTKPKLVIQYADGLGWTINPPSDAPCQDLPTPTPSVKISSDGNEATLIIPSTLDLGLAARDERGKEFILNTGDKFEISTIGKIKFSKDHRCVDADGMYGWYDSYVDSPFFENVGGLEFSIGNLKENRYFAGTHYKGIAEANGIFIGRVIEQTKGYKDDNSGAFTVTIKKK